VRVAPVLNGFEKPCVFLVPWVIDGAFDCQEAFEIDPVGRRTTRAALKPAWPGLSEVESYGLAKNSNAICGHTELQGLFRIVDRQF
jgi:hypothetical protein